MYKRDPAQAEAAAELRRRHDAAPWLRDQAPQIKKLRLNFEEERPDGAATARAYARPVVVESARAHFEVRCMEPRCDGVHDFTSQIVRAISERKTSDSFKSECQGVINNIACNRTLVCSFEVTYRD
jgi:hypothetical protein